MKSNLHSSENESRKKNLSLFNPLINSCWFFFCKANFEWGLMKWILNGMNEHNSVSSPPNHVSVCPWRLQLIAQIELGAGW